MQSAKARLAQLTPRGQSMSCAHKSLRVLPSNRIPRRLIQPNRQEVDMKLLAATIATLSLLASSLAQADWHGATPTTAMTHIAIQETLNGKNVDLDGKGQRRAIPQVSRRLRPNENGPPKGGPFDCDEACGVTAPQSPSLRCSRSARGGSHPQTDGPRT